MIVFRCMSKSIIEAVTVDMNHVTDHVVLFVVVFYGTWSW